MAGKVINIWTDGSCGNNKKHIHHGLGGWAFIAFHGDILIEEDLGFQENVNSAIMEMVAMREALRYTKKNFVNKVVHIHSDSAMVINFFLERWGDKWTEEGSWENRKNGEIWKDMLHYWKKQKNKVKFVKVKGHSGIPENERVDFLAGEARQYLIEKKFP